MLPVCTAHSAPLVSGSVRLMFVTLRALPPKNNTNLSASSEETCETFKNVNKIK